MSLTINSIYYGNSCERNGHKMLMAKRTPFLSHELHLVKKSASPRCLKENF